MTIAGVIDRTAVISGAASGIGRATAIRFAQVGADVAVLDVNEKAAMETIAMVNNAGRRGIFIRTDVTDFSQVKSAVAKVLEEFGQIDALASVAGWNEHSFFTQQEPDFWHKVVAINLWGQIHVARAVLDHMIERRKGAIVTVASDAGRVGTNGETIYAAAKGGVIAFTKSLAREVTRFGIRVNCICPGVSDTPMFQSVAGHQPKILESIVKLIPMRRIANPDEIAEPIVFLASESASYITGQTLSVNGGLNML